jgi:hypothetical protein
MKAVYRLTARHATAAAGHYMVGAIEPGKWRGQWMEMAVFFWHQLIEQLRSWPEGS